MKPVGAKSLLVALEVLALSACTIWYVAPGELFDVVHPIDVRQSGSATNFSGDKATVFNCPAELHAEYRPEDIHLCRNVDFTREKLVRVSWSAVGVYTDEMWKNDRSAGPLFGKLTFDVSRGGRDVDFFVASPLTSSGLLGETMHAVFQKRMDTSWFTLPRDAEVHYLDSSRTDVDFAAFFLLSMLLIAATFSSAMSRNDSSDSDDIGPSEKPLEPQLVEAV